MKNGKLEIEKEKGKEQRGWDRMEVKRIGEYNGENTNLS